MPRNYVPDTHIVRSALGMAQEKTLVPPVGQYSTYPNLLPYCLLPLFGGHFVLGKLSGDWDGVAQYKDHLLAHPEDVHGIARWLMVFFGALTSLAVFAVARAAGLRRGAWVASWFAATGLMNVHFSVQERPWVPMVFFAVLAAWPAVLYMREARMRRLLLSGACAGLAAACHQSGLPVLAIPGLAWLFSSIGWSGTDLRRRLVQGTACVALFALVALLLGYPSYLVHGIPSAEQTIGGDEADANFAGQSINFERRWETFPHLARAFIGYGPVLTLLALAGFGALLRKRAALPAALFALAWGAFFMTHSNEHVRYILPLASFLCLPAGLFVERHWARGRFVFMVLALLPLVQSLRLGAVLSREDSRAQGEEWIAELAPDALVLVDRYGPIVDQSQSSLALLMSLREATGGELYGREARRLQGLMAGELQGGSNVLYASDLVETAEHKNTVGLREGLEELCGASLAEALERLGVTHVLLVNRYVSGLQGNLLRGLVEDARELRSLSPSSNPNGELRLPMELGFALTSLWQVERPGPWLGLYELP